MLSVLRKSVGGVIAKIFIGLLILSFAVWGVEGLILSDTNVPLAKVGDVEISRVDYERMYPTVVNEWNTRLKQRLSREQLRAFDIPSQVKYRLINQAAVDSHVSNLELGVSDFSIGEAIKNDPQLRDQTGTFNKELLRQILRSERITEQQYFQTQRESALRTQLTSIFTQKKVIPKVMIDSLYHYREDKINVEYFVIPEGAVKKASEPTEAELNSFYETAKASFKAPEYRKVALYVLSMDELKKKAEISEKDVKATYELRKKSFNTPANRTYSQIVFETMEKALEAHKALIAGKDFNEVAKEFGKSTKADSVGPVTKASMADAKLADAVFGVKEGEYTAPVEGRFAITIAKVDKVVAAVEKTLEDVRPDIEKTLRERFARTEIKKLYDKVEDLRASGMGALNVAKEMNGTGIDIKAIDAKGLGTDGKPVAELPKTQRLTGAIFSSAVGDDTVSVRHSDGGYVWFDVLEIMPSRIKKQDEIKDELKAAWLDKENKRLASEFASTITKEIEDKKDFAAVASRLSAKVVKPDALGRGAKVDDDIPVVFVNRLFSVKEGGISSGLAANNKNWVIVKVNKHEAAKTSGPAYEAYKTKIETELQSELTSDLVAQYLQSAKTQFGVVENKQVFDQLKNAL